MTTDTSAADLPADLLPTVVPTPDDHLPCAACGVAVPADDARERIGVGEPTVRWVEPSWGHGVGEKVRVRTQAEMTRCPSCADRLALARLLVDAHPGVARRIGSPAVAVERVTAALDGLAALGAPLPDAATTTGTKVARLVRRLWVAGAPVTWASRRSGDTSPAAEVTSAPWAHLTDDGTADLRDAYAAMLSDAVGPRPTPPPDDGSPRGCLFCGVGTAVGGWEPVNVRASTLGSRQQGDPRVSGYLCAVCADETSKVGAVGPEALERALLAHLGVTINPLNPTHLDGLVGWYATGSTPSRTRWAHVDLGPKTRFALGID